MSEEVEAARVLDRMANPHPRMWREATEAYAFAREATERGKWAHMGRVNSFQRLRRATAAGYDSVDGTYLAFGPDTNLPGLLRWLAWLDVHVPLGRVG